MNDIAILNDKFRKSFIGGEVLLRAGIAAMSSEDKVNIVSVVQNFDNFTTANDPYGEHDFGCFDYKGQKIFFKIDYYDKKLQYLSEDPTDDSKTIRTLTIMQAEDW